MPDPAAEAARLGLPYTEPTSRWTKKAKVRFEAVPDPFGGAPRVRRVIEPQGLWSGIFGGGAAKGDMRRHSLAQGLAAPRPLPPVVPAPKQSWWKGSAPPGFRPLPPPTPAPKPTAPLPPAALAPTPFPAGFEHLPWHAKRHYKKMYKAELKAIAAWERSQLEAMRATELEKKRKEKEEARVKKEEEKLHRKQLKYAQKYPYGDRQLPWIPPPDFDPHHTYAYPYTYPAAHNLVPPLAPAPAPSATVHGGPVDRWVMAPTLEEFGVRRPFNAPTEQKGPTLGGVEWPMMSRTMHHALMDLAREENLHRLQAGQKMPSMPGY